MHSHNPSKLLAADTKNSTHRRKSLRQRLDYLVRKLVWNMDVAPSAWIASSAYIDRTWPSGIQIGKNCVIEHEASVLTHDMTRGLYLDTKIGAGTLIGARAIIMPGLTIGENCIIDPGAVVVKSLQSGTRVRGNPATPYDNVE